MLITINRNTITKFSKKAWIALIMEKGVMRKYSSLNRNIRHLDKQKDQEDPELIKYHRFIKQMMPEV